MKKTPKKQTHPVMMLVFFLFAVGCIAALFLFAIARPSASGDGIDITLALVVTPFS